MKEVIKRIPIPIQIKRLPLKKPQQPFLTPSLALRKVTSRSGYGVYASSDTLFKGAVFGRDSLEVAEDLLTLKPRLVRRIILTLASLQGTESSDINEEDVGKIVHEYRTTTVDGKIIKGVSRHIFDELASRWGGTHTRMAYYGSVDATPHYIRLVASYCDKHGRAILRDRVERYNKSVATVRSGVVDATDWLIRELDKSQSGLLEYRRRNPHGIENQVWKDSREFYVHENGEIANHELPIASIEVQGLVYDALMGAAEILTNRSEELVQRAHAVRDTTIGLLWQPERQYFALGIDYESEGKLRIIKTMTANPAALLDSRFFDDVPAEERQRYISSIVRTIMSREFLTDAGIRSRALSESHLVSFWDYHGSYTSWPKETYDIAKGLRRQGFPHLALELENRLLNIVRKCRNYFEFIYVDDWGRVLASSPSAHEHGELVLVDSTNKPETIQAWTVSAVMAIIASRLPGRRPKLSKQEPWQINLEKELLAYVPKVSRLKTPWALSARYPDYPYKLVRGESQKSGNFIHIDSQ